jgi:hypothetical protein
MTISDSDLEAQLRGFRARADEIPPAPHDLADRVRDRHRTLRRREFGLAAAAVAVVLIVVGVPVLDSTFRADGDRSHAAAPSPPHRLPTLADLPTRGSLADDEDWLRGVRQLSWQTLSETYQLPAEEAAMVPDPPVDARTVAFAGDVPGGRVALVLSRTDRPAYAWFTGPKGAAPGDMSLATMPSESQLGQPSALEYTPDRASGSATLVLVAWPGDEVDQLTSRTVSAAGETTEHWSPVRMDDGAGAIAVDWRGRPQPAPEMRIHRANRPVEAFYPDLALVDMPQGPAPAAVDVADPKGLRSSVTEDDLRSAIDTMTMHYVARPEDLHPTLLAGGPVVGDPQKSSVLVGFTFPSGATAAALVTVESGPTEDGGGSMTITTTDVVPAGIPLLDQVLAVPGPNSLTVSGPASGVLAEVFGYDGTLLAQIPLAAGAGSASVTETLPGATVRILDEAGTVVAESPLTTIDR